MRNVQFMRVWNKDVASVFDQRENKFKNFSPPPFHNLYNFSKLYNFNAETTLKSLTLFQIRTFNYILISLLKFPNHITKCISSPLLLLKFGTQVFCLKLEINCTIYYLILKTLLHPIEDL